MCLCDSEVRFLRGELLPRCESLLLFLLFFSFLFCLLRELLLLLLRDRFRDWLWAIARQPLKGMGYISAMGKTTLAQQQRVWQPQSP